MQMRVVHATDMGWVKFRRGSPFGRQLYFKNVFFGFAACRSKMVGGSRAVIGRGNSGIAINHNHITSSFEKQPA